MRMPMVRRAGLTVLLLILVAASPLSLTAQTPSQVVLAMWGLPTRLIGSVEAVTAYVLLQIHDVLAVTDAQGRPVPRLAESWTRAGDQRTYTVRLRAARFQDGRPVTAEDVKFSYELYLHPRFPTTAPALFNIEGARAYKDGRADAVTGITVVDPRTVRITLTGRYAFFVDQILGSTNYILPRHALAGVDVARVLEHPYARRPVGAGPFQLVEWRERESMTFQASPHYWRGRPSVDRLVIRLIPEPSTVMAELRAGNVDAGQIIPDEFEAFQRNERLQTVRMPGDASWWFAFNHQHPFFRDVRVRQAFYYAIDRQAMVRTLQKGFGRVVNSPIHPSLWQYNPAIDGYPYDPERARALLREAGFAPGAGGILQRDGRPFRVRYTFLSEKRYQDQGLMIQQFLRQVGVELVLEPLERGDFFGRYFQPANAANVEIVGIGWFNLLFPVQAELEQNFLSTSSITRLVQYANPELDALIAQASTADRGTLKTIYFRIQELILRDVPRVMTFRPDELWAVNRRITMPEVGSLVEFFTSIAAWKTR